LQSPGYGFVGVDAHAIDENAIMTVTMLATRMVFAVISLIFLPYLSS
jgi:hypothetical protein